MNNVSLEGRLTRDPELDATGKKPVCDMRLAVNGNTAAQTVFIDVAAFGDLAADTAELAKGQAIRVEGALRYSEWETKTEPRQRRSRHSIVAREVVVTA
ncbi:MAG TPA: single-stranded DNA-binding protein [Solirubrobacterales bacterium]|jgi:single stranded DNA-binding protein|nr:single-stranded DNA-binding protein [Solirubrobacterales bacterium]